MAEGVGLGDNDRSRVGSVEAKAEAPAVDTADADRISAAADAVPAESLTKAGLDVAGGELAVDGVDGMQNDDPAKRAAENPAGILADPTKTPEQLGAHLRGLSTAELTRTVKGIDTPELGYGAKVRPEGWKALNGEIDRRFSEAWKNRTGDQDLANLSQEMMRQPGLDKSWEEKNWRDFAGFKDVYAPENREFHRTLEHTTQMRNAIVNGGLRPADMTNGELLKKVGEIPGLRMASDVAGLAGIPGVMASMMGEGKIQDRLDELGKRIQDGRLPPMNVDTGEGSPEARAAGTAIGAAQLVAALNPRNLVTKGFGALFGGGAKMTASEARISGVLREAATRKGNFGLGTLTRSEALQAGEAWVGPGFTKTIGKGGETVLTSADGLRRYRDFMPKSGQYPGVQANLESLQLGPAFTSLQRSRNWSVNGHISLEPDPSLFQRLWPF